MEIPLEYEGREQSFLKHRVLEEYLRAWAHKLGSLGTRAPVKLWYVDCFSGPWKSHDEHLTDTSIHKGLKTLEEATRTWAGQGRHVETGAIFVEQNADAFQQLDQFLKSREGAVRTIALRGAFGDRVDDICRHLKEDPAFVFVDPTGFKGAAMRFLPPLMRPRMRDVLVNVMYDHMNRFRTVLPERMRDFFNLEEDELPASATETELFEIYRRKLGRTCALPYVADLRIPHAQKDRTWFRLVVGGKSPAVLDVFRRVEARVLGREASDVRELVKQRLERERSGQTHLFATGPEIEPWYQQRNSEDRDRATQRLLEMVHAKGASTWAGLWPEILAEHHLMLSDARKLALALIASGKLAVEPPLGRRRTLKNEDRLRATG